jgi:hypothetical protein
MRHPLRRPHTLLTISIAAVLRCSWQQQPLCALLTLQIVLDVQASRCVLQLLSLVHSVDASPLAHGTCQVPVVNTRQTSSCASRAAYSADRRQAGVHGENGDREVYFVGTAFAFGLEATVRRIFPDESFADQMRMLHAFAALPEAYGDRMLAVCSGSDDALVRMLQGLLQPGEGATQCGLRA